MKKNSLFDLYFGNDFRVFIYNRGADCITKRCEGLLSELGCTISDSTECDLAVAPCLNDIIHPSDVSKPRLGTLVFHPSLLPLHRGRGAVKQQFRDGSAVGGGTWFWCGYGMDDGDICIQEPLRISGTPRSYYESDVTESAVRMLGVIIPEIKSGFVRRQPQNHSAASYCYQPNSHVFYQGA